MLPSTTLVRWFIAPAFIIGLLLLGFLWNHSSATSGIRLAVAYEQGQSDVFRLVNGPPTSSVHDNLRNDTLYITGFVQGGMTNSFMSAANLIYLAMLSSRIPIMPPFSPGNIGGLSEIGPIHFGDVWNIPLFREQTSVALLEWREVKKMGNASQPAMMDILGCWTLHATAHGRTDPPHGVDMFDYLALDASYTPVPDRTRLEDHKSFHGIATLGYPDGHAQGLELGPQAHDKPSPFPSSRFGKVIPPDHHLMCMDTVYYVSGTVPYEWFQDYSPAWKFVGRHLKFSDRVLRVTEAALRRLWNLREDEPIPKFIAVHDRRTDFKGHCDDAPTETCFPPPSIIARYVDQVRKQLIDRSPHNTSASVSTSGTYEKVLIMSDETDSKFWDEVRGRGWWTFGWERNEWSPLELEMERVTSEEEIWGHRRIIPKRWWPTLVDAACQSLATGFVGSEYSTMSLLAIRRVREWNGGVGVIVPFGPGMYLGAQAVEANSS
ncbi:hypothetical protein FRB97_005966 [Tulasnella sp. 331]|nr:hypothetical protein FRB97_005966 [Tulasnella sp. 331]